MALALSLAALTVGSYYNHFNGTGKVPPKVGLHGFNTQARPPAEKYPDPSRYGRPSMINIRTPNPVVPDLSTMRVDNSLLKSPLYRTAYQTQVTDRSNAFVYGMPRIKDPLFAGNQNRFGPSIRMKRTMADPRNDPDFAPPVLN